MSDTLQSVGALVSLWRYPVKSMGGEELNAVAIAGGSLLGDRPYALVDSATGKVASAKHPRKWPGLFQFRATFVEPPQLGAALPPVRVMLPDGFTVTTKQANFNQVMSQALEREVALCSTTLQAPHLEEFWPEVEGLAYNDVVTDVAPIHILTTATLDRLRDLYPQGRFEARRFRPNIVIEAAAWSTGFVENDWVGHTLAIGDEVRLSVTAPCPRCVMTTLPQSDLPGDLGILRTAVRYNKAHVGVYATVLQAGTIRRGDAVRLE